MKRNKNGELSMKKTVLLMGVVGLAVSAVYANTVSESQQEYIEKYKKQKTIPKPAEMLINTDKEPDLCCGFVSLFNGKDLTGWTPKGGEHTYEVVDGAIVGTCIPGQKNAFLTSNKEYSNFIFTCEMKWEVDMNSGVMIRARTRKKDDRTVQVYGPQCEMEGFGTGRGWSGGMYGEGIGGWLYPLWLDAHQEVRKTLKKDDWNRLTIKAEGDTIKTWVNGLPATHWKTSEYMKGIFGLQVHSGGKGTILWRNIKVKELDSAG
jgi:hypothetical protein